jgi:hypothetical protein
MNNDRLGRTAIASNRSHRPATKRRWRVLAIREVVTPAEIHGLTRSIG